MAQAAPEAGPPARWLTFTVAGETLALPAAEVAEVARVPACTRVPNGPAGLRGLANLRGLVLPVVSVASLLGRAEPAGGGRLLVLAGAAPVGLVVDRVDALGAGSAGRQIDTHALLGQAFGGWRSGSVAHGAPVPEAAPAGPAQARRTLALLGLRVAGQDYALKLGAVAGVIRMPATLAGVPRSGAAMLGVAAWRGGLLPVVSLAALLGLPAGAPTRIAVTVLGDLRVGLAVDGVPGTLGVAPDAVDPVPAVLTRGAAEAALDGICRLEGGSRLVGLLSPARLFDAQTTARLQAGAPLQVARQEAEEMSGTAGAATEQFVLFRLGDEQYGLPAAAVDEVVRRPASLTRVPGAPDFIDGVMNLRGHAVPVIGLARRFDAAAAAGLGRHVIVVTTGGLQAGLAVDAVTDVRAFRPDALRPAPEFTHGEPSGAAGLFDRLALQHEGRMVLLVSPQGVLDRAEADLLAVFARGDGDAVPVAAPAPA